MDFLFIALLSGSVSTSLALDIDLSASELLLYSSDSTVFALDMDFLFIALRKITSLHRPCIHCFT